MTKPHCRRIAVIGGGANDEHAISLASASAIVRALRAVPGHTAVPLTIGMNGGWFDEAGVSLPAHQAVKVLTSCDAAFPALHGVHGEDGAIAGFLDLCGVPFVGSPVRAGALGMDKHATKLIARSLGILTANAYPVETPSDAAVHDLKPPFVVKPSNGGSSNGVFVVTKVDGIHDAVRRAREFGNSGIRY